MQHVDGTTDFGHISTGTVHVGLYVDRYGKNVQQ